MDTIKNTVVNTSKGKIKGAYLNNLYVFKGIPFAQPPTGERRWMPPQPSLPWKGEFEALCYGPRPPQVIRTPGGIWDNQYDLEEPQSEDCLYLNIWTPGLGKGPRPVMVWIYGGGFTSGSGSKPKAEGDLLASRKDVVVVTLNHRLGLLGFLNLDKVTGGKIPSTGNEGVLDVIAALKWVKENIAGFGGDPNNVTVFGQSSGAMSIGCMMVMAEAKGLFHKAILQSGTGAQARPLAQGVETAKRFLEITGLGGNDVAALRALSVEAILTAQGKFAQFSRVPPVAPIVDGNILPDKPLDMVKAGKGMKIPLLIGTMLEEMKIGYAFRPESRNVDEATVVRTLQGHFPEQYVLPMMETYKKALAKRGTPAEPHEILTAITTDGHNHMPALRLAQAGCDQGQAVYNYLFCHKSPAMGGTVGALHGLDVAFVFGKMEAKLHGEGAEVEKLSLEIQDAWSAFARSGDPSCQSLGQWPQYCPKKQTMILSSQSHVEEDVSEGERLMWDKIGEIPPTMLGQK